MFEKLLIANRGEIAVRIIRTCREMGIRTVAVYSEADRHSRHRWEADEAMFIGPPDPARSYLNIPGIIEAAHATGCGAIHPGYGFLSENPEFPDQCHRAGITFIGPPARVIRDMGDKLTARHIMIRAGVPVIPGLSGQDHGLADMLACAREVGYPVLIKASAGGGGKGIRRVTDPRDLEASVQEASREALGAFGDGRVYLEKGFDRARHIEFQILADTHGTTIHLLERECSVQRRHQKIIEETPSLALSPGLREEMGQAACAAARAAGYVNAGTVEFLLDDQGRYYFMEMNTRLQVEHPVTELVTGIDLVRQQIRVAAGLPLELTQADISARGHAIECRVYAEDPENGFFPSPGQILACHEPSGPGIRVDSGIVSGAPVPVEYDPILAKLSVLAETRDQAIARMITALKSMVVLGVRTPVDFMAHVLDSEPFRSGKVFTTILDTHFSDWQPLAGREDKALRQELACLACIADDLCRTPASGTGPGERASSGPFQTLGQWRL